MSQKAIVLRIQDMILCMCPCVDRVQPSRLLLLSQPQTLHHTSLYLTLALPLPLNYKSALTSMPFFERAEYINISGGTFIEISGDELGHYQLAFINGFPDY